MSEFKDNFRVPTTFEMWLACSLLTLSYNDALRLNVAYIIDAYVKDLVIDVKYMLGLRGWWYESIIRGLTKGQINELVNIKG